MRPISRETITERRQPVLRWSAVFAGAAVAVACWVLLQMIGMGAGLATLSLDDAGSLRSVGIGTTVWTFIVPLLALFAGGAVAGRLATSYDARVGAMHGLVSWAIASVLGILVTVSMVGMVTDSGRYIPTRGAIVGDDVRVDPDLRAAELQVATERAGKLLLGGGISLLFALGASVGGGVLVTRRHRVKRRRRTTAEVLVVPPPPEPPANAPHVHVQ